MSTISLRLPESLHDQARKLAQEENISLNQLITLALAEKLSVLRTEEILGERAQRGSRKKFLKALTHVPAAEPAPEDRIDRMNFGVQRQHSNRLPIQSNRPTASS